ncbi:MAG: hypothetical protein E7076_00150 [Bacteroidales bacterium]|nr:hypothetical protein [Bacteroidales bacterium]
MNQQIDIEYELSALWQRIYDETVRIAKECKRINIPIELSDCQIKSVIVDNDGTLLFITHNGKRDYAENYEDAVMYEVFQKLTSSIATDTPMS